MQAGPLVIIGRKRGRPSSQAAGTQIVLLLALALISSEFKPAHLNEIIAASRERASSLNSPGGKQVNLIDAHHSSNNKYNLSTAFNVTSEAAVHFGRLLAPAISSNRRSNPLPNDETSELVMSSSAVNAANTRQEYSAANSGQRIVKRSSCFAMNEVSCGEEQKRVKRRVPTRAPGGGKTGASDTNTGSSPNTNSPAFAAPIGNVSAVLGRDVRLVCTVDNLGQHQVAWLKEETKTILSIDTNIIITNYRIFLIPDEEGRKWVLHIKDVQESDRGFYQCQVNTNPRQSMSGYLEVVVPPTIIEPETSQVAELVEHSNASIQCKASGHPPPTISWRREDGEPIKLSGSNQMKQLAPGSSAHLSNGTDNRQPALGGGPRSSVDETLSRQPGAGSVESSHASRYSSSSHLNDVKSDKLSLINVDRTMAGLYVCTASNGIPNQVSRQIPVYVKFPPKVTIEHESSIVYANLGDRFELNCLIEAFPKPTIYWSGRQLGAGASSMSSRSSRVSLTRASLRPGWYRDGGQHQRRAISPERSQANHNRWNGQYLRNSGPFVQEYGGAIRPVVLAQQRQPRSLVGKRNTDSYTSALASSSSTISSSGNDKTAAAAEDDDDSDEVDDGKLAELEREGELVDGEMAPKSANEQLKAEAGAETSAEHPRRPEAPGPVQQARTASSKGSPDSPTSPVTVSQTAQNAYTYKLKMTIARVRPSDYGEYVCIATNSMGTSSARVLVKDKGGAGVQSIESMGQSIETMAPDNQADYQRDSLISETTNSLWTNQMIKVAPANGLVSGSPKRLDTNKDDDSSQYVDQTRASKPTSQRQTNRVYDENYLQSIRNRQSSPSHVYLSQSGKLQQKLMLATTYGEQQHQRNSATKLLKNSSVAHLLLATVATCSITGWILFARTRCIQSD